MIDSGADGNFVDHSFALRHNLPLREKRSPIAVVGIDGRPLVSGHITQETQLKLVCEASQSMVHVEKKLKFSVISSPNHDVILGLPWLRKHQPDINWKSTTFEFASEHCAQHCELRNHPSTPLNQSVQISNSAKPRSATPCVTSASVNQSAKLMSALTSVTSAFDNTSAKPTSALTSVTSAFDNSSAKPTSALTSVTSAFDNTSDQSASGIKSVQPNSEIKADLQTSEITSDSPTSDTESEDSTSDSDSDSSTFDNKSDLTTSDSESDSQSAASERNLKDPSDLNNGEQEAYLIAALQQASEEDYSDVSDSQSESDSEDLWETIHSDVQQFVPPEYADFLDVFSEVKAKELPPHRTYDCAIELLSEGDRPPCEQIYPLSPDEDKLMHEYISENLKCGFIRPSTSSAGASVFFVEKEKREN